MEKDTPLIKEGFEFAKLRYGAKKMPNNTEKVFNHALNVYFSVYTYTKNIDTRIAAMFHDMFFFHRSNYDEVARHFSVSAADLIKECTDNKDKLLKMGDVDYYIQRFNRMSPDALLIKLCERKDLLMLLEKTTEEYLDEAPYFPGNFCGDTVEIIAGIRKDKIETSHRLAIESMTQELDRCVNKMNKDKK